MHLGYMLYIENHEGRGDFPHEQARCPKIVIIYIFRITSLLSYSHLNCHHVEVPVPYWHKVVGKKILS